MKLQKLTGKELAEINNGTLKQVHAYYVENVLAPRGTMEKESLGELLLEKLESAYESWTDEKFADNPDSAVLIETLRKNLLREVNNAWKNFTGMDDVELI